MPNKDKPTMDYWKHSVGLFDEIWMRSYVGKVGTFGYTLYCYLMEKVNKYVVKPFILDDDVKYIAINDLRTDEKTFDNALNVMLDRNIFNKKCYEENKILTNGFSEDNKEIVVKAREKSKEAVKRFRNKKVCNGLHNDYKSNVLNKDIDKEKDIDIDKDTDKDIEINKENNEYYSFNETYNTGNDDSFKTMFDEDQELDIEEFNLNINGEEIKTKRELFDIVCKSINKTNLSRGEKILVESLYKKNSEAFSKSIEICLNSNENDKNIHSITREFYGLKKNEF